MNIVSGCVQLCKVVREFAYNISHNGFLNKAKSCQSSIQKSVLHLKTELRKHFRVDFQNKAASPFHDDELSDTQSELMGLKTSPSPSGVSTSLIPSDLRTNTGETENSHSPPGNCASPVDTGNGSSHTKTGSHTSLTGTGNGSQSPRREAMDDGNDTSPMSRSSLGASEFSFSTGSLN